MPEMMPKAAEGGGGDQETHDPYLAAFPPRRASPADETSDGRRQQENYRRSGKSISQDTRRHGHGDREQRCLDCDLSHGECIQRSRMRKTPAAIARSDIINPGPVTSICLTSGSAPCRI